MDRGWIDRGWIDWRTGAWLTLFVVAAVSASVAALVQPEVLATVVDDALAGTTSAALVVFGAVFLTRTLLHSSSGAAAGRVSALLYHRFQVDIADQVMRQGIVGRMSHTPGAVATRRNEAEDVAYIPVFLTNVAIRSVTAAVALIVLAAYQWVLAVVALGSVAAMVACLRPLMARMDRGFEHLHDATEEVTQGYLDAVGGRRTIAACGLLDTEIRRLTPLIATRADADGSVRADQGRALAVISTMSLGSQGLVLVTGVALLESGSLSGGTLVAALLYARMFYGNVFENLNQGWTQVPHYRSLSRRHRGFLDLPPVLAEPVPERRAAPPDAPVDVEMREVHVRGDAKPILSGLDLRVGTGSVAIVGRSGVGKSTIGYLVGRLIECEGGTVSLGSVDVSDLAREELAGLVGYAFERPAVLGSTIREFVTVGRSLDDEQVWQALDCSSAADFVERLPQGLDEPVETAPLSGGEWQRLGIARAVADHPPVLVLDDPTSSLDSITEMVVRQRLRALTEGCTVIVIAHRASMARWADQVAWLRDGTIATIGTHDELWSDPEYRAAFGSDE